MTPLEELIALSDLFARRYTPAGEPFTFTTPMPDGPLDVLGAVLGPVTPPGGAQVWDVSTGFQVRAQPLPRPWGVRVGVEDGAGRTLWYCVAPVRVADVASLVTAAHAAVLASRPELVATYADPDDLAVLALRDARASEALALAAPTRTVRENGARVAHSDDVGVVLAAVDRALGRA